MRKGFSLLFIMMMLFGVSGTGLGAAKMDAPEVVYYSLPDLNADQLVLRVNLPEMAFVDVELEDAVVYQRAQAQGAGEIDMAGFPAAPVYRYWILVPNGKTAELSVDPGAETATGGILLAPAQEPLADLEDAPVLPFAKDELTYGTDADYPGVFAQLSDVQVMRGQQAALLEVFPYQHNPDQRTFKEYHELTVTVTFDGDIQPIEARLKSVSFDKMYRGLAINAGDILPAQEEAETPGPAKPLGSYGWDYLIFCDSSMLAAANSHAAWKTKQGFKPLVTQIPKNWKASDLKSAILAAYEIWDTPPEYVLLIGDAEFIPPFYKSWHLFNSTKYKGQSNSQGYTGTDLYYSTLQSSTPNDPDGDLLPDVLLGRLSVDDQYQAQERVDGIYDYERWPPAAASFYQNVIFAAQFQDGGDVEILLSNGTSYIQAFTPNGVADRRFTQSSEDLAQTLELPKYQKNAIRMYYTDSNVTPTNWYDDDEPPYTWKNFAGTNTVTGGAIPSALLRSNGFQWNSTAISITQHIEAGSFLVSHRDHGGRLRWSHPTYEWSDVFLLQNMNLTPVVWSINCQTGWFDNETDFQSPSSVKDLTPANEESFAEFWERPAYAGYDSHNYGAVGVVAASRVTYSGHNDRFYLGMADAIWSDAIKVGGPPVFGPVYEMASVMNLGKGYMTSELGNSTKATIHLEGYHWFGDPAMEIRTEKPPLMIATHETNWPWLLHPRDYLVNVQFTPEGSRPSDAVEGAKVAITHPNLPGESWVGRTDAEGDVVFPDLLLSRPGSYDLTVMASNFTPVTTTFEMSAGPAAGIRFDERGYTCDSEVSLQLADINLEGLADISLQVVAEDGIEIGDRLDVTLVQEGPGTGIFNASFNTTYGPPNLDDDLLQVMDGHFFAVEYYDEDDGLGGSGIISDTVFTDCAAPDFSGLESATTGVCSVDLAWQPGGDASGPLEYHVYRSETPGQLGDWIGMTWAEVFSDRDCRIGQTFYYTVTAVDRLGQVSGESMQLWAPFYGAYLPVVVK